MNYKGGLKGGPVVGLWIGCGLGSIGDGTEQGFDPDLTFWLSKLYNFCVTTYISPCDCATVACISLLSCCKEANMLVLWILSIDKTTSCDPSPSGSRLGTETTYEGCSLVNSSTLFP